MKNSPTDVDIAQMERALGMLPRVMYSPPHVYATCIPQFEPAPKAERPRMDLDKLRLYVHVPFCNYHCNYCFYAVKVGADRDLKARYVEAVLKELEWVKPGTLLSQLFVGGGTPMSLPPELLDRLLEGIFSRVTLSPGIVHTVEAAPDAVTPEHLQVLKKHGVERVSMGIQSLDEVVLESVTRGHSEQTALDACRMIVDEGFILNVDLIYGLPNQTEKSFRSDLEAVRDAGVQMLTLYDLRTNEMTTVNRVLTAAERLNLRRLARWRWFVNTNAEELGFSQFRWHSYKRMDSTAKKHALKPTYTDAAWGYQLGVGNGSRSHLGYTLSRSHRNINSYMERVENGESPVEEVTHLNEVDRRTLFVISSLGYGKKLSRGLYAKVFERSLDTDFGPVIERMKTGGLLEDQGDEIGFTERGSLVHDYVTLSFYPQQSLDWLMQRNSA